MAVAGLEWVVIGIILIVLILWGPSQIPKIAKAFGQAKKEFEKAAKEGEGTIKEIRETANEALQPFTETVESIARETEDVKTDVIRLARQLGIKTEGKTKEQIVNEIAEKLKKE
jgi:sec-independent protein translocase protein TatA